MTATIEQLWIYPVKACKGISVQQCNLTPTGALPGAFVSLVAHAVLSPASTHNEHTSVRRRARGCDAPFPCGGGLGAAAALGSRGAPLGRFVAVHGAGFEYDRAWCIVDLDGVIVAKNEAISMRKMPVLATISTQLSVR